MELLEQLGINWKLFFSQAVNFFILLAVLTMFVYKPLIKVIKDRNQKIKEGLDKAEEADVRLKEIDNIGKEKIKQAETQAISIIKDTEGKAKVLEGNLQKEAEKKQAELLAKADEIFKKQQEENKKIILAKAAELVKQAIVKTVELNPKEIDEKLIATAVENLKHETK